MSYKLKPENRYPWAGITSENVWRDAVNLARQSNRSGACREQCMGGHNCGLNVDIHHHYHICCERDCFCHKQEAYEMRKEQLGRDLQVKERLGREVNDVAS